MSRQTDAAGYIRMSSDKQEASPQQQRAEIERMAERGSFRIVKWYEDLGVSGDDTEHREAFKKMINDATTGEFELILCWDQDRFGRFDSIEGGFWIHPLRKAGIELETVVQGRINWNAFEGRLMYSIQQEGKHQFLRDLSRNVTRGMEEKARQGVFVGGKPPVGYTKGEDGKLRLASPEEVALVRKIFHNYLEGHSLRSLASSLTINGYRSSRGGKWTSAGIYGVLKNLTYLGHAVWNQRASGRYKKRDNDGKKFRPEDQWITVRNAHPPIVDESTFKAVQERLEMNANRRGISAKSDSQYVLSGLLYCGKCGHRMIASKENGIHQYVCYSYRQKGSSVCDRNAFRQDYLVDEIIRVLQEQFFNAESVEQLKAELRKELTPATRKESVELLKSHMAGVNTKLEKAKQRLLEVQRDMVRIVEQKIRELEMQQRNLADSILAARRSTEEVLDDTDDRMQHAIKWFGQLREAVSQADPRLVREFFREMIARVEIYARKVPQGKRRHTYEIETGIIYLQSAKLLGYPHCCQQLCKLVFRGKRAA